MKKNCNDIICVKFNYIVKAGKFTHLVDAKSKAKYTALNLYNTFDQYVCSLSNSQALANTMNEHVTLMKHKNVCALIMLQLKHTSSFPASTFFLKNIVCTLSVQTAWDIGASSSHY